MIEGSCLCGETRFRITGRTTPIGMCHCSKCRKVSGVASNANLMVGKDAFEWVSGEPGGRLTGHMASLGSDS